MHPRGSCASQLNQNIKLNRFHRRRRRAKDSTGVCECFPKERSWCAYHATKLKENSSSLSTTIEDHVIEAGKRQQQQNMQDLMGIRSETYPNEAEEQLNPAVFFFGLLLFLTMSSLRSSLVEIKGRKTRHGNIHGQYTTPKAGFDFSRSAADGLWLTKELSKVVKQSRSTLPPPRCSYAKFLSAGLNTCLLNHNNFSRHTRTLDRY